MKINPSILISIVVFAIATFVYKALVRSNDFSVKVTERLQRAGFGEVRNQKELAHALTIVHMSQEKVEALMCLPEESSRQAVMHEFIKSSPRQVNAIREGQEEVVVAFYTETYGLSKEFLNEFIKCVRDSTYFPKQIGVD